MIAKKSYMHLAFLLCLFLFWTPAWTLDSVTDASSFLSFSIDWSRAEVQSQASLNLAMAGIRLPAGRFMAEEALVKSFPPLMRPHLLNIRVDSSSTIADLLERGRINIRDLDNLSVLANKNPSSLSRDLSSIIADYSLPLERISAYLWPASGASQPQSPLIPVRTAEYTGIIIIANEELPVHGRMGSSLVEPCLFPKIWDTGMNLVYDRNMFDAGTENGFLMNRYTTMENIFLSSPSGLEGYLADLLGERPLRIIARSTFGISPTDLIIHREDAMAILSTENNRSLLREGRVLFVVNESVIRR